MTASLRTRSARATRVTRVAGLLVALTAGLAVGSGGGAVAAHLVGPNDLANNAVHSRHIQDHSIRAQDLGPSQVNSGIVKDDSLTGADIAESTLGQVPSAASADNAATVGGRAPSSFASSSVYKRESAVTAGTALGDGTFVASQACDPGDLILDGGPANVAATSDMVESFPTPDSTSSWSARINKHGQTDNWSVVVLCLDQTP